MFRFGVDYYPEHWPETRWPEDAPLMIDIILGTPTASPPPWLMTAHPDAFRVMPDGRAWTYGHRREYCPNNPAYREHSPAQFIGGFNAFCR